MISRRCTRLSGSLAGMLLVALAAAGEANGQDNALPDLNSLKPSSSPAFILLNVAPASVERPRTPSDVGLSVLNNTDNFSKLPNDYSAEFAPYWLVGHPTLHWRDDITRSPGASLARTLDVAFATANVGTDSAPATGLGLGFSAYLLSGRMSERSQKRLEEVETLLRQRSAIQILADSAEVTALNREYFPRIEAADQQGQTALRDSLLQEYTRRKAVLDSVAAQTPAVSEAIAALDAKMAGAEPERVGLFWGVAGGAAWRYPDGVWDRGRISRFGFWTTLSYEGQPLGKMTFTPVAVIRFLGERGDSTSNLLDGGARFVLSSETYSASVEGVVRLPIDEPGGRNLYRIAGIFDYRLADKTWLSLTFGRDYQSSSEGSLIAQLGVKVHFARDRYQPQQ